MNNQIFLFFYSFAHQSIVFDKIVVFTAIYLPYLVVISASLFLLFHYEVLPSSNLLKELANKWKNFIPVCVSSVFAWIFAVLLKNLFQIPRPILSLPNIYPLFSKTSFAFPSEHALFFSALSFSIFFINKKAGYVFLFLTLLIGISRIIAGVHFPLDIFGGFVLGALVAYFAKNVYPHT